MTAIPRYIQEIRDLERKAESIRRSAHADPENLDMNNGNGKLSPKTLATIVGAIVATGGISGGGLHFLNQCAAPDAGGDHSTITWRVTAVEAGIKEIKADIKSTGERTDARIDALTDAVLGWRLGSNP